VAKVRHKLGSGSRAVAVAEQPASPPSEIRSPEGAIWTEWPTHAMRKAGDSLTVVAMSTSHTYTQRYTQSVSAESHQTSADNMAAATKGAPFSLRPLRVSDRDALRTLFARLSPESRRRRFLTGKTGLSDRELTYFTDIDHLRHEALTAIDPGDGSIVGVARYVMWPERADAADVAIEVADDIQRNGIGLMLAEALIQRARENGIKVLTATTLWENHAARALARRMGFRARSSAGNEIELELQLPDPSERNTARD
jgi:RimJ/RimL family protein N-acetyltransferase